MVRLLFLSGKRPRTNQPTPKELPNYKKVLLLRFAFRYTFHPSTERSPRDDRENSDSTPYPQKCFLLRLGFLKRLTPFLKRLTQFLKSLLSLYWGPLKFLICGESGGTSRLMTHASFIAILLPNASVHFVRIFADASPAIGSVLAAIPASKYSSITSTSSRVFPSFFVHYPRIIFGYSCAPPLVLFSAVVRRVFSPLNPKQ